MFVDSGSLVLWDRLPSFLLLAAAVPLEVSFLAVVVASDVVSVSLDWSQAPLDGAGVYGSCVCFVRSAAVVSLFLAVSLVLGLGVPILALLLLLA